MSTFRRERLGVLIQEKIGALIVGGRIKDPRVDGLVSLTRVEVSADLAYADVYVSVFRPSTDDKKHGSAVDGLQSAAGFIQSCLARDLHTRVTPRLRFHRDTGLRAEFDIIQKIDAAVGNDE